MEQEPHTAESTQPCENPLVENKNIEEGSADESTLIEEVKELDGTHDLQNQKEVLETHADHLHKTPGHGWKHYLFEFFMLFLAVFCGFLAEYQLEHRIERERVK